jgi:hypothetical protein
MEFGSELNTSYDTYLTNCNDLRRLYKVDCILMIASMNFVCVGGVFLLALGLPLVQRVV